MEEQGRSRVYIVSSPFHRCIQTAKGIQQGILDSFSTFMDGRESKLNPMINENVHSTDSNQSNDLSCSTAIPADITATNSTTTRLIPQIEMHIDYGLTEWQTPYYFPTKPESPPQIRPDPTGDPKFTFHPPVSTAYPRFPETVAAMRSRYVQTASIWSNEHGKDSIVVLVSHGNGIQSIVESFCPEVFVPEVVRYCCLSQLVRENGQFHWVARLMCSSDHLGLE